MAIGRYPTFRWTLVPDVHPPHPRPTLRELGDRAQVRAIDAIEKAAKSPTVPWEELRRTALSDETNLESKTPTYTSAS